MVWGFLQKWNLPNNSGGVMGWCYSQLKTSICYIFVVFLCIICFGMNFYGTYFKKELENLSQKIWDSFFNVEIKGEKERSEKFLELMMIY